MPPAPEIRYDFSAPSRIVFGWGRRNEAGKLARSLGRRAFVVCGSRTLEKSGPLAEILAALDDAGVEAVRTESITREPLTLDVDRCVDFLRKHRAGAGDLLLAVGGGSALDLAKAAGAVVTQSSPTSVLDFLEGVGNGRKITEMPLPLLAMPTTGGTGTEATKNAVISSFDPPFKKSLRSELMVPRIVLVDPELAVSLPPHVTAWTGMDAITQLLESLISRRASAATRHVAICGLELALPQKSVDSRAMNEPETAPVVAAFRDGSLRWARERMAQAALFSGIALANSGLGMAHGVAAALGVHCHVPHGLACAIMLPAALRANLLSPSANPQVFGAGPPNIADSMFLSPTPLSNLALAQTVVDNVEKILADLKIPRRLSEIGVRREQLGALVCDSRGNSMSANPRDISDEELSQILEEMF